MAESKVSKKRRYKLNNLNSSDSEAGFIPVCESDLSSKTM